MPPDNPVALDLKDVALLAVIDAGLGVDIVTPEISVQEELSFVIDKQKEGETFDPGKGTWPLSTAETA